MKKLLKYIINGLVTHPKNINIKQQESDYGLITLDLQVHPDDIGRIIGKRGSTIEAIRKLIKIKAVITGKRYNLNLIDPSDQHQLNRLVAK